VKSAAPPSANSLNALEATFVAPVIRPFSTHRPTEIVSAPRRTDLILVLWPTSAAGRIFDGRILLCCGALRTEPDHLGREQSREVSYWRDKRGHEVDFVLTGRPDKPIAVECKWSAADFCAAKLRIFRRQYSEGENFVLAHDVDRPVSRRFGESGVQSRRFAGAQSA